MVVAIFIYILRDMGHLTSLKSIFFFLRRNMEKDFDLQHFGKKRVINGE